jgi:large subunit ribosomal protein L24
MRKRDKSERHRCRLPVRKGDTVVVISGKDAHPGKRGVVQECMPLEQRVRVEGINLVWRHRRPRTRQAALQQQQGRIQMPGPIHVSNVMLVCPRCDQPTRPRREVREGIGKVRVCRRCNELIDEAGT